MLAVLLIIMSLIVITGLVWLARTLLRDHAGLWRPERAARAGGIPSSPVPVPVRGSGGVSAPRTFRVPLDDDV